MNIPQSGTIKIGVETWYYNIQGNYTNIENEDQEFQIQLRWAITSENEVRAAAYGMGRGFMDGKLAGRKEKVEELKKVLDFDHI